MDLLKPSLGQTNRVSPISVLWALRKEGTKQQKKNNSDSPVLLRGDSFSWYRDVLLVGYRDFWILFSVSRSSLTSNLQDVEAQKSTHGLIHGIRWSRGWIPECRSLISKKRSRHHRPWKPCYIMEACCCQTENVLCLVWGWVVAILGASCAVCVMRCVLCHCSEVPLYYPILSTCYPILILLMVTWLGAGRNVLYAHSQGCTLIAA